MSLFDILFPKKNKVIVMPRITKPGALEDDRTEEEKQTDFHFVETVASAAPASWVEKDPSQWRKFPIRSQNGSGTCVAQTEAKELGIMYYTRHKEFVDFSAGFIYKRRLNKNWQNSAGMVGVDARDIVHKNGCTLEVLMPSQNMTDSQVDASEEKQYYRDIAKVFAISPNYVMYTAGRDFETIASTIQVTGKAVMVWFRFEYDEWTDIPFLKANSGASLHHSVAAVDAVLYKGKKYLVIEDSWGEFYGFKGQRLISEEFFKARNSFASYLIEFKMYEKDQAPNPTKATFGSVLEFIPLVNGEIADPIKHEAQKKDVVRLQDILKKEGLMAKNIDSTGYYGAITAKSVLAFQRKYQVASEAELAPLMGRRVGQKTIDKLNELYGSH